MKLKFLCPTHRQWLNENNSAAVSYFKGGLEAGKCFRDKHLWQDALPHLGCAFETAEIILSNNDVNKDNNIINFTSCAILLTDTFKKLELIAYCQEIFSRTEFRLLQEINRSPNKQNRRLI